MTKLEVLKKSVENRLPISFEYNKPGKTQGIRIGNVHAIFIFTAKSGAISTKLHVVQTKGVTDSADKGGFPFWRSFNIEHVSNVEVLEGEVQFEIETRYKPESYDKPIAKI
jgi:hypothetical protein